MHVKFDGVRDLTRKPDVVFVIDPSYEHNAIKESRDQGLEIFGICDTNSDPSVLDHVIPANDDGPKSLKLMMGLVEEAIESGLAFRGKELAKEAAAKEAATEEVEVKIDVAEIEKIEDAAEEVVEKKAVKKADKAEESEEIA
jgi:small subunit ribosomal protein S2